MSIQITPSETQRSSNGFTAQYDLESQRDVGGEILALALVATFLAVIGYVLYSTHGEYEKTKDLFDTVFSTDRPDRYRARLLP